MADMDLNLTFEDIGSMKKKTFKNIVDRQVKKASLEYMLSNIKSKGKEIKYGKVLKCQGYLMPNLILTLEEQLTILS